ncbi:MAG: DUF421 domain-containing protein [Cytophagaceae bacterium]|nr:MAG: DUF421 domain-containing protein [Cytophagaceae bacterium]
MTGSCVPCRGYRNRRRCTGVLGFALLALLQFVIAWAAQRFGVLEAAVKAKPCVLLYDGVINADAMLAERITQGEIAAAVRKAGYGDFSMIAAVVLETDGSFSVVPNDDAGDRSAL